MKPYVWRFKLEIRCFPTWTILSNTFFIGYKLNFIAIGYRRNLRMLRNHHFTKYYLKLEVVVSVCLCSKRREVNWNFFFFLTWLFPFLDHFWHVLGIIAVKIKRFSVSFVVSISICMDKKSRWYMYIPSWDTFYQTIQRPDWLGLLKTDNIITWQ